MSTIPKTMRAIQVEKTGGPEQCVMREIPVPVPEEDEVLIKIEWTGANFIDNYLRKGLYPKQTPFPLGQDAVGTLVHVPSSISHTPDPDSLQHLSILPTFRPHKAPVKLHKLELGQRVFTASGPAFAEYMVAPWSKVAPMPEGVDPRDGVSMASIAITALTLIKEAGVMRKGEWCLVRAAAGGVGAILVQLAKYVGANLIATVSSEAKAQLVKSLGAEHVLLTSTPSEENVKTILGLTNGKGVHVVYDGVGADTWEEDFLIVRPKGTIVTFGNASGPVPPFPALKLSPKSLTVVRPTMGPYISTPEEFAWYADEVFQAVQDGALKFLVHKEYPFTEEGVQQTQIDITSRGTTGKLLIRVA